MPEGSVEVFLAYLADYFVRITALACSRKMNILLCHSMVRPELAVVILRNGLAGPALRVAVGLRRGSQVDGPSAGWGWLVLALCIFLLASCGSREAAVGNAVAGEGRAHAVATSMGNAFSITEKQTTGLAARISSVYGSLDRNASEADPAQYLLESNGVLTRPGAISADLPAVFVSGAVTVSDAEMRVVLGTEVIDSDLKDIVARNREVVQAYYNDRHSYNRIYPPFDVLTQYPAGMDIPSYNFYYLADAAHNPERVAVWVGEPYVDPAGRGWMVSCVAPVYVEGDLEGVCGLDITVEAIVRNADLEGENNLLMVVSGDGTVVAAGELMIRILRLPPLKNHRYVDTVRSDTFRSEDYNLLKSSSGAIREMAERLIKRKESTALLELDSDRWRVTGGAVGRLDWMVLEFENQQ